VPLPLAYRSLPRPSSPPCAQASSTCLRSLDYIFVASRARAFLSEQTTKKQKRNCRHCDDSLPTIYTNFRCQTACGDRGPSELPLMGLKRRAAEQSRSKRGVVRAERRFLRIFEGSLVRESSTHRSRKEVIQPQVPLRLPCYDFAPVTALAFGRLVLVAQVPTRTSGAHSFHGVTGGVYKARERIHRGAADPRLLAIPASCSRVADYNPN
jgi:hypothetical protein